MFTFLLLASALLSEPASQPARQDLDRYDAPALRALCRTLMKKLDKLETELAEMRSRVQSLTRERDRFKGQLDLLSADERRDLADKSRRQEEHFNLLDKAKSMDPCSFASGQFGHVYPGGGRVIQVVDNDTAIVSLDCYYNVPGGKGLHSQAVTVYINGDMGDVVDDQRIDLGHRLMRVVGRKTYLTALGSRTVWELDIITAKEQVPTPRDAGTR